MSKQREIQAIVSVFEGGTSAGDPSACVILPDGAGISYGVHQGTDRSGTLDAIVQRYSALKGGSTLDKWRGYLAENRSTRQDPRAPDAETRELMAALVHAGRDPVMRTAQEQVFDALYWVPAVEQARAMGLVLPLSLAVIYDTCIHSGPGGVADIRKRFPEMPPSKGGSEKAWTRAYIQARRGWLATHHKAVVRGTVYRMDALMQLANAENWQLTTPFTVRGVRVA